MQTPCCGMFCPPWHVLSTNVSIKFDALPACFVTRHVLSPPWAWTARPCGDKTCWKVHPLHVLSPCMFCYHVGMEKNVVIKCAEGSTRCKFCHPFVSTTVVCLSSSLVVCVCVRIYMYFCVCACVRSCVRACLLCRTCSIIPASFSVKLIFCIALSRPQGSCCLLCELC